MSFEIIPFSATYVDQIREINRRLAGQGFPGGLYFPEGASPDSIGPWGAVPDAPYATRQFLVLDADRVVGAFILRHQAFELNGRREVVVNLQLPQSIGVYDRRYAHVAGQMMRMILERYPYLFAVGMGSPERPLPRLLKALRFHIEPVPFQFAVLSPRRFLSDVAPRRLGPAQALAARVAGATGAGWVAIRAWEWRLRQPARALDCRPAALWGAWADELWQVYRGQCAMIGVRDAKTLAACQSIEPGRLESLRLEENGRAVGWVTLLLKRMKNSPHFGNTFVATLLDAVCEPGRERAVTQAARRAAAGRGAELLVSNQRRQAWRAALREAGFLEAPSNFLLALSPPLAKALEPLEENYDRIHLSRADGDGRVHL